MYYLESEKSRIFLIAIYVFCYCRSGYGKMYLDWRVMNVSKFIIMIVASVIVSTIFGKTQNVAEASGFRRSFGGLVDVVCSIMFFAGIVGVIYTLVFA